MLQINPMCHSHADLHSRAHSNLLTRCAAALALVNILGMALPAPAHAQGGPQGRALPWTLVDTDAHIPTVSEGHSAIVFLKLQDDALPDGTGARDATVSVFVDGSYHASLPKASWAYAEVCSGPHALKAVQDKTLLSVAEGQSPGRQYQLPPSSTSYFQLREDDKGAPVLEALDSGAAAAVAAQLPRAVHTISRVLPGQCAPKT